MIDFFKKLIDSSSPTSSKRFVGLIGSFSLMIAMFMDRNDIEINSVLILCLGCFAITGIEQVSNTLKK